MDYTEYVVDVDMMWITCICLPDTSKCDYSTMHTW